MKQGIYYDLPEKFKYSTAFESKIVTLDNKKAEKFLSLANKSNLKKYLPKDFNLDEKFDCLAIAGEAFVANKLNLNGDGVKSDVAIRLKNLFPLTLIDKNHKRDSVIGVVLSAYLVDEDDKEISEEAALKTENPFKVVIGGIVWKLVDKNLTEALEESNNLDSKWYGKLFHSWELGFTEANLIKIPKDKFNFTDGEIITDEKTIRELENRLKANGGSGEMEDGEKIGRIIVGEVLPVGLGIVLNPAGQLNPIVVQNDRQLLDTQANTKLKNEYVELSKISKTDKNMHNETIELSQNTQKISQAQKKSVIANNDNEIKQNNMKINNVSDINDEFLKTVKADVITDFITEEAKKADKEFKAEQEKTKVAEEALQKAQEDLTKVQAKVDELLQKEKERADAELFNQRMEYFEDTYELDDEERAVIVAEIKSLDEKAFDGVKKKYDIFLKNKSKAAKKSNEKPGDKKNDKEPDKDMDDKKMKKSKAEKEGETVIDDALNKAKEANAGLPNAAQVDQSFETKYSAAFSPENCIVVRK